MTLQLNIPEEAYKEFYGRSTEQMPKLIAEGRVPMNTSQLMQKRLDHRNGPADLKTVWMDNYFDTGDGVVYHPDGRAKIVLDSQTLREMTPGSKRNNGALILGEDVYEEWQGEEFKEGRLGKTREWLSKAEVKSHPVWKVLARDQALLDDYVDYIFAKCKEQERFGYDTAMGVSLVDSCSRNSPEMNVWCVGGLGGRSGAYGWVDLDDGIGRLVGIAPEALSALQKDASSIRAYSVGDLQVFDSAMKGL